VEVKRNQHSGGREGISVLKAEGEKDKCVESEEREGNDV
jgi:hypothetical protein